MVVSLWFDRGTEQEVAYYVCAASPASFPFLLFNILLKNRPRWETRRAGRGKICSLFECDPLAGLCHGSFQRGRREPAIWLVLHHSASRPKSSVDFMANNWELHSQSCLTERWYATRLGASNPPDVSSQLIKMRIERVTHNNNKKKVKYQLSGPVQFIKSLGLPGPLLDS